MKRVAIVAGTCLIALLSSAAWADDAADTFEQLFGAELKKVTTTHDSAAGFALATKLLEAAKSPQTDVALLGILCEKIYDLDAKDPRGYETAIQAMQLEAARIPAQRAAALTKALTLRQKQLDAARGNARNQATDLLLEAYDAAADATCRAGDYAGATALCRKAMSYAATPADKEVFKVRLDDVAARQKVQKQVDGLKAKVAADPADAASGTELVRLLVVELDEPAQAVAFLGEGVDESLKKYVPAAIKDVNSAPELACMELGDWYLILAEKASPTARPGALDHAAVYYQRFIDLHKAEDAQRARARQLLKQAKDGIEKSGRRLGGFDGTGWTDLLKLIDLAKDVKNHSPNEPITWTRRDNGIYCKSEKGHGQIVFPLTLEGPYELRLRLSRPFRGGQIRIFLPTGPTGVTLCIRDTESSFNQVAGRRGPQTQAATTELNKEYLLEIKVTPSATETIISTQWDGKPFLQWKGPWNELLPEALCCMGRNGFGVGIDGDSAEATFHSAEVRMLGNGQAKFGRTAPKTPPTRPTTPTRGFGYY
jgi:tetratricopeptide (TPR) repeat protein